jgi:hypothetical protein
MGHVEIFTSATDDFTNFLKMYGNLSMAIATSNSCRNTDFLFYLIFISISQNYLLEFVVLYVYLQAIGQKVLNLTYSIKFLC